MFKKYFIDEDFKGSRFDRWFKKTVSNVPQSYLEKNIRIGKIKVNNKKIKKDKASLKFKKTILVCLSTKIRKNKQSTK